MSLLRKLDKLWCHNKQYCIGTRCYIHESGNKRVSNRDGRALLNQLTKMNGKNLIRNDVISYDHGKTPKNMGNVVNKTSNRTGNPKLKSDVWFFQFYQCKRHHSNLCLNNEAETEVEWTSKTYNTFRTGRNVFKLRDKKMKNRKLEYRVTR